MARLRDFPKMLRLIGPIEFARRVIRQVSDDNLFTWAAALAYSWLFALFPFLLFLLALIPYLPLHLKGRADDLIRQSLDTYLAAEAAHTVRDNILGNVKSLLYQPRGTALYIGLLVAMWAASNGVAATMTALDKCYDIERGRPFYRQRILALTITIAVVILLVLVGALLPIAGVVRDWVLAHHIIDENSWFVTLFDLSRYLLSALFLLTVLAMFYHKGPSVKHRFRFLTPGSVFCLLAWILLGSILRFYMNKMGQRGYDRTYGALGGVAMLLLLFYVDALVMLIGAEINSEIDFEVLKIRRGSRNFMEAENAGKVADAPPPASPPTEPVTAATQSPES
jgi:membrane protein